MQNLAKLTVLKRGLTLTKIASQNNDSGCEGGGGDWNILTFQNHVLGSFFGIKFCYKWISLYDVIFLILEPVRFLLYCYRKQFFLSSKCKF